MNEQGEVTIEKFSDVLEWFGPFTSDAQTLLANVDSITTLPFVFFSLVEDPIFFLHLNISLIESLHYFLNRGFYGDDCPDLKNVMAGKEVSAM